MVCLRTYERKDAHEHLQASQMLAHSRLHVPYVDILQILLCKSVNLNNYCCQTLPIIARANLVFARGQLCRYSNSTKLYDVTWRAIGSHTSVFRFLNVLTLVTATTVYVGSFLSFPILSSISLLLLSLIQT